MSIKVLSGSSDLRHSLQDDMESFFYVVLYASIRWLPHDYIDNLAKEIRIYFGDCQEQNGIIVGGAVKMINLAHRSFFKMFEWRNSHLRDWIYGVLSLQFQEINNQGLPIWTPERLYDLWVSIDNSNLPMQDRFDHIVIVNNKIVEDLPVPATVIPAANNNPLRVPRAPRAVDSIQTAPVERHFVQGKVEASRPAKRSNQVKIVPIRRSKRQRGLAPTE